MKSTKNMRQRRHCPRTQNSNFEIENSKTENFEKPNNDDLKNKKEVDNAPDKHLMMK
jgi:hypothetical protein